MPSVWMQLEEEIFGVNRASTRIRFNKEHAHDNNNTNWQGRIHSSPYKYGLTLYTNTSCTVISDIQKCDINTSSYIECALILPSTLMSLLIQYAYTNNIWPTVEGNDMAVGDWLQVHTYLHS